MKTILVVDDEEDIRQLVAKMLRYGGFDVLEAESGAEASVVCAGSGPVDLVVADVVMAGESGPELGRRLQAAAPELKVLYISGCPHHRHEQSGQTAFLPKPFTVAELVSSVSELLTR